MHCNGIAISRFSETRAVKTTQFVFIQTSPVLFHSSHPQTSPQTQPVGKMGLSSRLPRIQRHLLDCVTSYGQNKELPLDLENEKRRSSKRFFNFDPCL